MDAYPELGGQGAQRGVDDAGAREDSAGEGLFALGVVDGNQTCSIAA